MLPGALLNNVDIDNFFEEVKRRNRTFLSQESLGFLKKLTDLCCKYECIIPQNTQLFRARKGISACDQVKASDFYPLSNNGSEGRANPYNINVLYVADSEDVAIAEVRAVVHEKVAVAAMVLNRDAKIIDFAGERPGWDWYFGPRPNATQEELVAFNERDMLLRIGGAFSKPLTVDDSRRDYIPTQIIAEYLKSIGYDGISYQSQFSTIEENKLQRNYAFFDTNIATPKYFEYLKVEKIIVKSKSFSRRVMLSKEQKNDL